MAIDVRKIEEDIKALEELKRFLSNPSTAALIDKYSNGHSNGHPVTVAPIQASITPGSSVTASITARGDVIGAVERACKQYMPGVLFTGKEVTERAEAAGFVFKAKQKDIAVNSALKRLVKRGVIEQVERAVGHRPAKYRIPVRHSRE